MVVDCRRGDRTVLPRWDEHCTCLEEELPVWTLRGDHVLMIGGFQVVPRASWVVGDYRR